MKQKNFRPVAILGGVRTPFVKSFTSYADSTSLELLTETLNQLVTKYKLEGELIGDVASGAVMLNSSDWNLAREAVLGTKLDPRTTAYNVQKACGTSLETTWQLALKISAGDIESAISSGVDTNSDVTGTFSKEFSRLLMKASQAKTLGERLKYFSQIRPNHFKPNFPTVVEPRTGKSMGQHCELMVQEHGITRQAQDQLALESHQKAARAYNNGFYSDLIFEFKGIKKDAFVRGDTSLEKLSKLKPAFDFTGKGTLTAGNSTPLTDGASALLLGSEDYAHKKNLPILAYLHDVQATAVDFVHGEGLLMAPTKAVAQLLARNNMKLQDFDYYEIHEAFAGQVLCTLDAWKSSDFCKKKLNLDQPLGEIDRNKMNVNGGSLAIGHPFAATGTRIIASLAKTLHQNQKGVGLISICTAGGMGIAAILKK